MNKVISIFIFWSLLILSGCSSIVEGDPSATFEENVLRPKISFSTLDSISVYVQYWKKGSQKIQKSTVSTGIKHDILLLNLTGEAEYEYRIHSIEGDRKSKVFQFKTEKIPEDIFIVNKEKIDTTAFNGYILIRKFIGNGADVILNNEGDVVWYYDYGREVRRQFTWTNHNTILSAIDTSHVVEIDRYGNQLLSLDLQKTENPLFSHHEILYDKEGALITLVTDSLLVNPNSKEEERYAYTDGIVKLSVEGVPLWTWNVAEHINLSERIKLLRKGVKGRISHSNSLTIDKDGNYLISFRDFAQVWKIDSKSGDVIWKLGEGGDLKMDSSAYFISQHSIYYDNDRLVIFDNGNPRIRDYSRILGFIIDEGSGVAKTEFVIDLPKEIASYRMGSGYQVGNDRFLVCTSTRSMTLSIVNTKGEILWKVGGSQNSFRAYFIKNPFVIN
ncbi:MAG: aryl-sulfate sulfotransferase [Cyclobacteriaceae bacterium]|nr:aryl-sulfate sulfotransferase [Cyclobacteriaceae bacterium]